MSRTDHSVRTETRVEHAARRFRKFRARRQDRQGWRQEVDEILAINDNIDHDDIDRLPVVQEDVIRANTFHDDDPDDYLPYGDPEYLVDEVGAYDGYDPDYWYEYNRDQDALDRAYFMDMVREIREMKEER